MSSACGDAVLVNPGGRIPVDGTVIAGHSFVDQSRITGESLPVEKTAGATSSRVRSTSRAPWRSAPSASDATRATARSSRRWSRPSRSRAPVQRLADRLAGYLVYFALGAAVLTYLLTHNITATISVIIVAGACGIAAGTPLAILGGDRARGPHRRHREGRAVSRAARPGRHRGAGQDRDAHVRTTRDSRAADHCGCDPHGAARCRRGGRAALRASLGQDRLSHTRRR